jgi:hypothetical protein
MPNALTLEHMSPGLLKVVETRNHKPHRRKSRMREIRSYGSGEGPGWATSRPTLQALFHAAPPAPPAPAAPAAGPAAPRALAGRPARRRGRAGAACSPAARGGARAGQAPPLAGSRFQKGFYTHCTGDSTRSTG